MEDDYDEYALPLDYSQMVSRIQWYYQQLLYQQENIDDEAFKKSIEQLKQIYLSIFQKIVFIKEFE